MSSLLWASSTQVSGTGEDWTTSHRIPLLRGAVPLLGSMVGLDPVLRQESASKRVQSMEPFFQALLHPLFTTQASILLLRVCALPKLNFTCRTLPSKLTLPACAAFDENVLGAAMTALRLNKNSLPAEALSLLTLPLCHGGFGLRSMVAIELRSALAEAKAPPLRASGARVRR